jgi:hypothetical protein
VYSDNNQRIGDIKDETSYVKYEVNNNDMNTIQRFGISVTVYIPKTLTTLFIKDSVHNTNSDYFVVKMLLQNYFPSHHQDVHLMLLMFLEEVI